MTENCDLTYEEVSEALESRARLRQTVTYNDLAQELGFRRVDNLFKGHPLEAYFEQLDAWDNIEGQPFRTALVVHKGDGLPGRGFFDSLSQHRTITIQSSDEAAIWRSEVEMLFHYFDPTRLQPSITLRLTHAQERRLEELPLTESQTPSQILERYMTQLIAVIEHEQAMLVEGLDAARSGLTNSSAEVAAILREKHGIDVLKA